MALHPDLSGDDSPANQAMVRQLVEAYRRLQEERSDGCPPTPAPTAGRTEGEPPRRVDPDPSHRRLQLAMVMAIVLAGSVVILFFLTAFSGSGR